MQKPNHLNTSTNTALFIDAENLSARHSSYILNIAEQYGNPLIRKIYADWTQSSVKSWIDVVKDCALQPVQQFNFISGKNSSDIALAMDVIELCKERDIKTVILASSDSDFTALALKLRNYGVSTIGIGKVHTNNCLKAACEEFFLLPDVNTAPVKPVELTRTSPAAPLTEKQKDPNASGLISGIIKRTLKEYGKKNRVELARVGQAFRDADIHPSQYKFDKLVDLIDALVDYETITEGSTLYVRERSKQVIIKSYEQHLTADDLKIEQKSAHELRQDAQLINAISAALVNVNLINGWASVGDVAIYLNKECGLHSSRYGYRTLSDLLKCLPIFELRSQSAGDQVRDTRLVEKAESDPVHYQVEAPKPLSENEHRSLYLWVEDIYKHNKNDNDLLTLGELGSRLKEVGITPKQFGLTTMKQLAARLSGYKIITEGTILYLSKDEARPRLSRTIEKHEAEPAPTKISIVKSGSPVFKREVEETAASFSDDDIVKPPSVEKITEIIKGIVEEHKNTCGLVPVGLIGDKVREKTGFGSHSFGHPHFGKMLEENPDFTVEKQGRQVFVGLK